VYSLAEARKITEEGVTFKSFIDGSMHKFTPENVIQTQRIIGADIIMAFDECTPYPCEEKYAIRSMEMTHRWLLRCKEAFQNSDSVYGYKQVLFPIVQGSVYPALRKKSAEFVAEQGFEGNAIGGLSVGEPVQDMYSMTDLVTDILPKDKPRYLMGVGTPTNILESIALGIDMFDCVMPTRNARNGWLFTSEGVLNIRNSKFSKDHTPIDISLGGVSARYSKSYLKHLLKANEMLGSMIASVHNLTFYLWLVSEARKHIEHGTFISWKNQMTAKLDRKL
jgi:queuine tRNA-ribosyltransferase